MAIIGIDLGTTNSLAVVFRHGQVEHIPNQWGSYLTPSVVSIKNKEAIVGQLAKERLVTHPQDTAQLFKRKMGSQDTFRLAGKKYLPEELSAYVVKQLVADAEAYLGEPVEEAVISVPAYFNAKQRRATKKVGELIGIKVERIINEPSAAAIACHEMGTYETFVVFDFGGGTLDVSVVDRFENVISICAIAGDNYLGGSDIDLALARYFCQQHGIDWTGLSKDMTDSLILKAERLKMSLTEEETAPFVATISGQTYETAIDQATLRLVCQPTFDKIRKVIAQAVKDSGFEAADLDAFILVGGSSQMPLVQDYLRQLLNLPLKNQGDLDQLVAKGLGTYIGIKARAEGVRDLVVTDICPFSMATNVQDELNPDGPLLSKIVIPKHTVLPASKTVYLQTVRKGQKAVTINVFQGEALFADDNLFLGGRNIPIPSKKDEYTTFSLTYAYDINSMLYVELKIWGEDEKQVFRLGDKNKLVPVTKDEHLDHIKDVSMALSQQSEFELCLERGERLYMELPEEQRKQFGEKLRYFNANFSHKYLNNIQKRKRMIQAMHAYYDMVEKHYGNAQLDIFKDFNDDEE